MADANYRINIILRLQDEATPQLKSLLQDAQKTAQSFGATSTKACSALNEGLNSSGKELKDLKAKAEEATGSISEGMLKARDGIREFRQQIFAAAVVMAAIIGVTKEWAEHNYETKRNLDSLGVSIKSLAASIGSILAPVIQAAVVIFEGLNRIVQWLTTHLRELITLITTGFTKAVGQVAFFFQELLKGKSITEAWTEATKLAGIAADNTFKQMHSLFTENIPQVDLMKTQLGDMNDALDKLNIMYLTGAISAQQYYDTLSSNNVANLQNMQMQMQLTQQMAAQENLMRSQSLLDYSANIQARMGLLKTLESYHHTIYSTMTDFANMAIQKISSGLGSAISAIATGTKKASEAFKEFGVQMIASIVAFVVEYGIQMLISWALSKLIMASTIAQAGAIAAAWLPAALYASIATMGGADAAGVAGLATATASGMALGTATIAASTAVSSGAGGGFAEGGEIPEYIVGFGLATGKRYTFGEKGREWVVPENKMGGSQIVNNINIYNPVVRSEEDIRKIAEQVDNLISREVERI